MKHEVLNEEGVADLLAISTIRSREEKGHVDLYQLVDNKGQVFFMVTGLGGGGFLLPALVLV